MTTEPNAPRSVTEPKRAPKLVLSCDGYFMLDGEIIAYVPDNDAPETRKLLNAWNERDVLLAEVQVYKAQAEALRAENERLRKLLVEAASDIDDWGQYAGDYFKKKHDLDGCVKQYRDAAVAKHGAKP